MRPGIGTLSLATVMSVISCNAVLGLEDVTRAPDGTGASGARAGGGGSAVGGTADKGGRGGASSGANTGGDAGQEEGGTGPVGGAGATGGAGKGGTGATGGTGAGGTGASSGSGTGGSAGSGGGGGMSCGGPVGGTGSTTPASEWASWPMPNPPGTSPNPQSYTDNEDGTVTDEVTGLRWQQSATSGLTWDEAKSHCAGLGGDWRLPTAVELFSLFDASRTLPAIDANAFPGTASSYYWSSSPAVEAGATAWTVHFSGAAIPVTQADITQAWFARCVGPGGPSPPTSRYSVVSDAIVDNGTELMWEKCPAARKSTFDEAALYCAGLGPGWRVPTVTELETLVDRGRARPAIDVGFFPGTPSEDFWTSTLVADTIVDTAWSVAFRDGSVLSSFKIAPLNVRCVK